LGALLITQSMQRQNDYRIQGALGASAWSIRRQIICRALLVAAAGSAIAVWTAPLILDLLVAAFAATVPRVDEAVLNPRVQLLTIAAALAAAGLVALVTSVRLTDHRRLPPVLRTPARVYSRRLVLGAQVMIAVLLVVLSADLVATGVRLTNAPLG